MPQREEVLLVPPLFFVEEDWCCPQCDSYEVYEDGVGGVCWSCGIEWSTASVKG